MINVNNKIIRCYDVYYTVYMGMNGKRDMGTKLHYKNMEGIVPETKLKVWSTTQKPLENLNLRRLTCKLKVKVNNFNVN